MLDNPCSEPALCVPLSAATELVGPSYRVIAGFVSHLCYSMGYISLAILGYLVRDWRWLEITITLPVLSFVILYWLVYLYKTLVYLQIFTASQSNCIKCQFISRYFTGQSICTKYWFIFRYYYYQLVSLLIRKTKQNTY